MSAHCTRIITYYQTHHDAEGNHISVLPLVRGGGGPKVTHVMLAAIHLNKEAGHITLNDHVPDHERFTTLWAELRILQASGVKVMGMLGGAAPGTFDYLGSEDNDKFEGYYVPLGNMVREHGLDGLDLDVEQPMTLGAIVRLIDRLRLDFGPDFIISLAPVAMALLDPTSNLSGFDYAALEAMRGQEIAFYNTQFYCGWGNCNDPLMFNMMVARGWRPEKIVIGLVTNPENGSGFVPWERLVPVLTTLASQFGTRFGGVMGWEYFNSLPGGRERPWEWAGWMTACLGATPAAESVVAQAAAVQASPGQQGQAANVDDLFEAAPVPDDFEYFSDELAGA